MESRSSVEGLDIVYTFTDLFGEALFARRDVARRAAQICRAVKLSKTWAEFYIPPGSAKKIIRALRAQGHHVAKSTNDLPDWISLISS